MFNNIDKRERAAIFRNRLDTAMENSRVNQSQLSRQIGVDRSTISQLLKSDDTRLPNAHVIGECAAALGVSADWLLGLADHPEQAADLLASAMKVTPAPRALIDEQIISWHHEAEGYKIRHVPATLPDMLKTPEMLDWEYEPQLGRSAKQAIGSTRDHLDWMRKSSSDYEIALPLHELASFAQGVGYYAGLPRQIRLGQIDRMLDLHDQLYPSVRVFLFDARRLFSAPITVFGPLLAVIYLGQTYLAYRDKERVTGMIGHFDWLVRESSISAREFPIYLQKLRSEISN